MNYGERIKKRRTELEMTAEDLAELIGKSRATVYRYENGDIEDLPITVIDPLASALNTTPAYLMGWSDDPNDYDSDEYGDIDARLFNGDVKAEIDFDNALELDHRNEIMEFHQKLKNITPPEMDVIDEYRKLNDSGKDKAYEYVRDLSENPRYCIQQDLQAAHERTDIEVSKELIAHDDDIMNDDNF